MSFIQQLFWRISAVLCLLLALIGIPLPGLPTVPFLLLSAWCASKGWPRLERWLLQHPQFGPPIRHWREHGVVSRKAKWLASLMMALSLAFLWHSTAPWLAATLLTLTMTAVLLWLWQRPEHKK